MALLVILGTLGDAVYIPRFLKSIELKLSTMNVLFSSANHSRHPAKIERKFPVPSERHGLETQRLVSSLQGHQSSQHFTDLRLLTGQVAEPPINRLATTDPNTLLPLPCCDQSDILNWGHTNFLITTVSRWWQLLVGVLLQFGVLYWATEP